MSDPAALIRRIIMFLVVDNLRITVVMVLGAAAIYLLLPRPRARKALYGAGLGLLAVLLAGVLLVGTRTVHPETFLFYAFSATAVIAGALLVTQRNPARAALSFALVVLSSCGLFLLLAAPFLMAATVIIYAGAIVVTFLFVLMLAQQEGPSDADYRSREPLLSVIAGFILLGTLLYVLQSSYSTSAIDRLLADFDGLIGELDALLDKEAKGAALDKQALNDALDRSRETVKQYRLRAERQPSLTDKQALEDAVEASEEYYNKSLVRQMRGLLVQLRDDGRSLPRTVGMLQPPSRLRLSELSGPASNHPLPELRRDEKGQPPLPAENTAYLGRSLFTDYLLAVELGGTLLLVATIGAIAIAFRRPGSRLPERTP
jgi:NADH:ubiquinone oxidoreductase subunit 6 (subunit J)